MTVGQKADLVLDALADVVWGGKPISAVRERLVKGGLSTETAHRILQADVSTMFVALIRARKVA